MQSTMARRKLLSGEVSFRHHKQMEGSSLLIRPYLQSSKSRVGAASNVETVAEIGEIVLLDGLAVVLQREVYVAL